MSPEKISVVIPVYNEVESLPELLEEVKIALDGKFDYEIQVIDDGSTDGSFECAEEEAGKDGRIEVTRFLRNYGKSAAISVGFRRASGDYVVTMDADLQDDPAEIPSLVEELKKGYDLVSGWKKERMDPASKRLPSRLFNSTTRLFTGIQIHDFNCGLKAYRNSVVKTLDIYGGMHRYIPVLAGKRGFRVTEKPVNHRPRRYGVTKFGRERYFAACLIY